MDDNDLEARRALQKLKEGPDIIILPSVMEKVTDITDKTECMEKAKTLL